MALKIRFTSIDDGGIQKVETATAPGGHLSVSNGLLIVDDAGTQVFAVPMERVISVEKTQ